MGGADRGRGCREKRDTRRFCNYDVAARSKREREEKTVFFLFHV